MRRKSILAFDWNRHASWGWILCLAMSVCLQARMPGPIAPGDPPFEDYSSRDTLSYRRITRTTETIDYRECASRPAQLDVQFEWRATNEPSRSYKMTRHLCLQKDTIIDTSSHLDVMGFNPRSMLPTSIYSGYPTKPLGDGMTEEPAYNPFGNGFWVDISVDRYRRAPLQVAIRGYLTPKGLKHFEFDATVNADSPLVTRIPKSSGTLTIVAKKNLPSSNGSQTAKNTSESDTLAIRRFVAENVTKSYEQCHKDSADVEIDLSYAIPSLSMTFHKKFHRRFVRRAFSDTEVEFDLAPATFGDSVRTIFLLPAIPSENHVSRDGRDSGHWGRVASGCVLRPQMGDSVGFWLMVYGNLHADSAEVVWDERFGVANDTTLHWETPGVRVDAKIRFLRDPKRSRPQGPAGWLVWTALGAMLLLGLLVVFRRTRK